MKKVVFFSAVIFVTLTILSNVYAERDWEYWSKDSFEVPLKGKLNYCLKTEWRANDDMTDKYYLKIEQAPLYKINNFFEIAPYYVWQEKKTNGKKDRSDLLYLDLTGKFPLKKIFNTKLTNRLRYQYNFDKEQTVWRDSLKFSKDLKIKKYEFSPFIEEEIFFDTQTDEIYENWASAGVSLKLWKNVTVGIAYLLDSKKKDDEWGYANVIVTSLSVKF